MKNTRSYNTISAVVASSLSAAPVVEILSYELAGSGLARVTVDVTHNELSRKSPSAISTAIRERTGNSMEAVAGSFTSLDKGMFKERITGLISVVRKSFAATEDSMNGFRAIASNMFMDDEENMWVMRKTEAGQLLVQTTGIDDDMSLVKMLDSCSSGTIRNASQGNMSACASSAIDRVQGGDFVSYVNMFNQVAQAFVVVTASDTDDVLVMPTTGESENIQRSAIVSVHPQTDFPAVELTQEENMDQVMASARGVVDLDRIEDYYRKVYARSPAFFQMFVDRLRSHQFM